MAKKNTARAKAPKSPAHAPRIARVPITNIYMDGDYTGQILVGPSKRALNVILDTGSSALAIDGRKYTPDIKGGDRTTNLAQYDTYGDGSNWTGAVLQSNVAIGSGPTEITVTRANVAVAYEETSNMFRSCDGILGLAYAPLDSAYKMPTVTWPGKYTAHQVTDGKREDVTPFMSQLGGEGVVSDKVAFYTRRSFIHSGSGAATDPLNQGWMIVGGGEESTEFYTGAFQTVKVVSDEWYCTNLKSIQVGKAAPIVLSPRGPKGMPSNSIVDSGTNSLNFGPKLMKTILGRFSRSQQALLDASVSEQKIISASAIKLTPWPDITFVLEGVSGEVALTVGPDDYWQVNAPKTGGAIAAMSTGQDGLSILGLPLMNGYFTIFDGEAAGGKGVIKFATSVRP
ncbi:MAG TPA: pepsin-like aspartic protease [Opitutaceae bacterium]|jgi:hypothetical protein